MKTFYSKLIQKEKRYNLKNFVKKLQKKCSKILKINGKKCNILILKNKGKK